QPVVPLQVDDEPLAPAVEGPADDRAPLLGVEGIGHRHPHDLVRPPRAGELLPVRLLAQAAGAVDQPPPQAFARRAPGLRAPTPRVTSATSQTARAAYIASPS